MEEVQKAIDGRKPDFAAYVEPQKAKADIIVQVREYVEDHAQVWSTIRVHVTRVPVPVYRRCFSLT